MSDSELLRIKNKRKAFYKSRKTARSILKNHYTPNDRFGFNYSLNSFVIVNVKLYICIFVCCIFAMCNVMRFCYMNLK